MTKPLKFVISIVASFAAGGIGSLATTPNIPTWYAGLEKPFFNPPNWVFGPVWTLLYILIGISFYMVWAAPKPSARAKKSSATVWFAAQLMLNALWSLVFFGMHAPLAGVAVILLLLGSIIAMMRSFWPISKPASYLLIPYIAWVSFASMLNISIAVLN